MKHTNNTIIIIMYIHSFKHKHTGNIHENMTTMYEERGIFTTLLVRNLHRTQK